MIDRTEVDEGWGSSGGESSTGAPLLGNGSAMAWPPCLLLPQLLTFRITTSGVAMRLLYAAQ